MQDSCEHRFMAGQKVLLVNHVFPESDLNGCLFVVVRRYNRGHYSCRLIKTTTQTLRVGQEYTLTDREMQPYCMFAAEMSELDIKYRR